MAEPFHREVPVSVQQCLYLDGRGLSGSRLMLPVAFTSPPQYVSEVETKEMTECRDFSCSHEMIKVLFVDNLFTRNLSYLARQVFL